MHECVLFHLCPGKWMKYIFYTWTNEFYNVYCTLKSRIRQLWMTGVRRRSYPIWSWRMLCREHICGNNVGFFVDSKVGWAQVCSNWKRMPHISLDSTPHEQGLEFHFEIPFGNFFHLLWNNREEWDDWHLGFYEPQLTVVWPQYLAM